MILTKKVVFILISIIYAGILSLSYLILPANGYKYSMWIAVLILLALVNYLLIGIYEYNNYLKSKLVFISLIVFFSYFLLGFFPTLGNYSRAAYILGTSVGLYMLLLAVNVYIVSEKRESSIPLLQPAKVIAYLSLVMAVFLASTIIYKLEWFAGYPLYNLAGKLLFFGIFYTLLFKCTSWVFISEGGVGGEAFNEEDERLLRRLQIFAVLCLTEFSFVLMFFPFEAFGRALILGGSVYYINSFIQNYIAHKITLKFLIEIGAALTLIYTLVYFT